MSINSKAYLPNDLRADDIVQAIAYLCGAKRIKQNFERNDGWYAGVDYEEVSDSPSAYVQKRAGYTTHKVFVVPTHDMQYFTIEIAPTTCDNTWHSGSLFLYPQEEHPNRVLVYGGVSEFWYQIDRALVNFFGGEVDDNDCDDVEIDYQKRKPRKTNAPSDGRPYQKFQEDLMNLPQLFEFVEEKK